MQEYEKGDDCHENMNGKDSVFTIREPKGSPANGNSKGYVYNKLYLTSR